MILLNRINRINKKIQIKKLKEKNLWIHQYQIIRLDLIINKKKRKIKLML